MLEQGEFYLALVVLFTFFIIREMWFDAKLLDMLEELAFPSDDPIMTSSLKEPVFEYEEEEPEEGESEEEANEEAVELTSEEPEVYNYEGHELVFDETRCRGINKSGRQCGRTPKAGELHCNQHNQ